MEILQAKKLYKEMETFCSYKLRIFLSFDDVSDITRKILRLPIDETRNFIRGYLNPDKSKYNQVNSFIGELLSMKREYNALIEKDKSKRRVVAAPDIQPGMVAYVKERDDNCAPGLKKRKKQKDKKREKKQQKKLENNEKTKFIRKYCECQALIHPLVGNCLKCGKIICSQEGEGPCMFCGSLEERNLSNSENIETAKAHRDKLIAFGKDKKVTRVYDDQGDHFDYQGNQWLSEDEKKFLKKKQEDTESKIRDEQRNIVITLDLAGRRIIEHDTNNINNIDEQEDKEENMLDPFFTKEETERTPGVFKNPFLSTQTPIFRKSNRKRTKDFLKQEGVKQKTKTTRISKTISCAAK